VILVMMLTSGVDSFYESSHNLPDGVPVPQLIEKVGPEDM
jgi:hypothetical protein